MKEMMSGMQALLARTAEQGARTLVSASALSPESGGASSGRTMFCSIRKLPSSTEHNLRPTGTETNYRNRMGPLAQDEKLMDDV